MSSVQKPGDYLDYHNIIHDIHEPRISVLNQDDMVHLQGCWFGWGKAIQLAAEKDPSDMPSENWVKSPFDE